MRKNKVKFNVKKFLSLSTVAMLLFNGIAVCSANEINSSSTIETQDEINSSITSKPAYDRKITSKEAVQMLLTAADDYNPTVTEEDITNGDENLYDDQPVTRVNALIMLHRAFGKIPALKGGNKYSLISKETFKDIPDWAQDELSDLFEAGIIAGKEEGVFAPYDDVTEREMKLFISRAFRAFGTNERDDFYQTVNKKTLENTIIPDGKLMAGPLCNTVTDDLLRDMIKDISTSSIEKNSKEYKIKTLYNNYLNKEARNKDGYAPIKPYLEAIDKVQSVSEFVNTKIASIYLINYFISFAPSIDRKNSNKYINHFITAQINSKDMYEGKMEKQKTAYLDYIKAVLALCGENKENAEKMAEDTFLFEKQIAQAELSLAEMYDLQKTYNRYSFEDLKNLFKTVDLNAVFENTGMKNKSDFIVTDVGSMEKMAELLDDKNLNKLKNFAKVRLICAYSDYLSDDFKAAQQTYMEKGYGLTGVCTDEYYATTFVSSILPEYIGEIYGKKYTTEKMIEDITGMIKDMINIYRMRISNLEWMTDTTKEKALKKLDTMKMKVGAPTEWKKIHLDNEELRSYEDGGSLVENIIAIGKARMKDLYTLEDTEVDKTEWAIAPQTVNACYVPTFNDIEIPVAFLQIPTVYDQLASYEENLGAIGFIIGHELSHAFDSSGSQYDENGNALNWWTNEDEAEFKKLCNTVIDYYTGQEGASGIEINPQNTINENIADLGAISVITELASKKENFNYKKMYESYAKLWATVTTREMAKAISSMDPHSCAEVRVNRVLQSVDKFYETYNITENDGMWVSPKDRVAIW